VEVYVETDGGCCVGSGYAITDDLVLTSGHLIRSGECDEVPRSVQVRPLGVADWLVDGVTVAWCRVDDTVDAALVRVQAAPWSHLPDRGVVRWGRPVPDERVACVAVGFPEAQARPGGVRDTDEVVGCLSPNTRAKAARLVVDLETPPPAGPPKPPRESVSPEAGPKSPWSGLSGGALLSSPGRRLLGVVAADLRRFEHRRLEAVGVGELLADPEFAALAGHPVPRPVRADEPPPLNHDVLREPYEELPPRYGEAHLLVPRYGVVPFVGRAAEIARLSEWCKSPEVFSVAVLTGEGGAGKSRLAAELCKQVREQDGWDAYVADQNRVDDDAWARLDPAWPLLLVFDYAERMIPALTRLINRLKESGRTSQRVRLLLIARETGGWWRALDAETGGLLHAATDLRLILAPDNFGPAERAEQAQAAVTQFAARLGLVLCSAPDVSSSEFDSPLLVHIAALLSLRGERIDSSNALGCHSGGLRERLLDRLLDRERQRWRHAQTRWNAGADTSLGLGQTPAHQAVALTSLTTPDRSEARELLCAIPDLADATAERRGQVTDWLIWTYPSGGDDIGQTIAALQPDLLTERLLATTPDLDGLVTGLVDQPTCTLFHLSRALHALSLASDRAATVRRALGTLLVSRLTELVTAAGTVPWSAFSWLLDDCLIAYGDPGPDADPTQAETARALAEAAQASLGTVHPDMLLGRLAITQARLAVRHWRTRRHHGRHLGGALVQLGGALAAVGQHDEATTRLCEAVEIFQGQTDSATYRADLAAARHSLAAALGRARRFAEAVTESEAATALYRELSAADPDHHRPRLAGSLKNHALDLTDTGRHADAIIVAGQAVELFTELAAADPVRYKPEFADALGTLAIAYARAGDLDSALEANTQAVAILHRLSTESELLHPDLLGKCASALANLSTDLADLGRDQEAVDAATAATDIRQRLAEVDPERYGSDLVDALDLLAGRLEQIGRYDEALTANEQAAQISWAMAMAEPVRYRRMLARILLNLGPRSWEAGHHLHAIEVTEDAVVAFRDLAAYDRGATRPDFAQALHNLTIYRTITGDADGAVSAAVEAIQIRRELTDEPSDLRSRAHLAASLSHLGQAYGDLGRLTEAKTALDEATTLMRDIAGIDPDQYRPDLAKTLNNTGRVLAQAQRTADALPAFQEALSIHRELAAADPRACEPALAQSLHNLGTLFCADGMFPQAVPLLEEAATLYLEQVEAGNRKLAPVLATTAVTLVGVLMRIGRFADAAQWSQKTTPQERNRGGVT
jgi:tetratricopeptide (TPR) repeat protein